MKKVIEIRKSDYERYKEYLNSVILNEDETIYYSAIFDDGYEVDIKICGADYEPAWTEAVLFKNGCECCCSECCDTLLGEWELEYKNKKFIVDVVLKENE